MSNKNNNEFTNERISDENASTAKEAIIEENENMTENVISEITGVVVAPLLNVRDSKANVISEIDKGTKVVIDVNESNDEFYKVRLASGIEGFCMKKYITIKQ